MTQRQFLFVHKRGWYHYVGNASPFGLPEHAMYLTVDGEADEPTTERITYDQMQDWLIGLMDKGCTFSAQDGYWRRIPIDMEALEQRRTLQQFHKGANAAMKRQQRTTEQIMASMTS